MEKVCPLCNALETVKRNCPMCGGAMLDAGTPADFAEPYSPYLDRVMLQNFAPDTQCVHLLACPQCGYDTRVALELVTI